MASRRGTLRIIAGTAGGLRLSCPKSDRIRPTTDRVREAIFNILGGRVVNARVLDLFAGTGAFAIEALSRGARSAVLVEQNRSFAHIIRRNLDHTRLADRARLIAADAFAFPGGQEVEQPFDIIFLDPPYRLSMTCAPGDRLANLADRITAPRILATGGILVFEHSSAATLPHVFGRCALARRRNYGAAAASFYQPQARETPGESTE